MYTTGVREGERAREKSAFPKIEQIPNYRIRARERERERGNEGSEDADPLGGDVGTKATAEGEGVSGGGFGHCGACVPATGRSRSRQPFCCRRGCSRSWNRCPHFQAYQGEDMCW